MKMTMFNPRTAHLIQVKRGFSWPVLFFGGLWYLSKGMWAWALVNFLVAIATFGVSLLVFPFLANAQYVEFLRAKGYRAQ